MLCVQLVTVFSPLQTLLWTIHIFSSYRAVNTFPLVYKNPYLFPECGSCHPCLYMPVLLFCHQINHACDCRSVRVSGQLVEAVLFSLIFASNYVNRVLAVAQLSLLSVPRGGGGHCYKWTWLANKPACLDIFRSSSSREHARRVGGENTVICCVGLVGSLHLWAPVLCTFCYGNSFNIILSVRGFPRWGVPVQFPDEEAETFQSCTRTAGRSTAQSEHTAMPFVRGCTLHPHILKLRTVAALDSCSTGFVICWRSK